MMRIFNILNLGAGLQSSRILLGACRGELPKFDAWIFADTQSEPKEVYRNLDFLRAEAEKAGIPGFTATAGHLRNDAVEKRRRRSSDDGKRYASLPTFVKNDDGSTGMVPRQCTKEYKIEVVEKIVRREILGLAPRARVPKDVLVRQWFGISDDEATRATFPGRFKATKTKIGNYIFGDPIFQDGRKWTPVPWKNNVYPLLNEVWRPDRTIVEENLLPRREQRHDCGAWLAKNYPGRTFPRSACIFCPLRSNEEWRRMKETAPEEFEDACNFDEEQRDADAACAGMKDQLRGLSFLHRQLVPLRMVNLDGPGEKGGGCGTLFDGQDGLCGV